MLELFDLTAQTQHVKSCIWLLSLIPQSVVPAPLHYFLKNPQKPQPLLYRPAPAAERHMFCLFPYVAKSPSVLNSMNLHEDRSIRETQNCWVIGSKSLLYMFQGQGRTTNEQWAMALLLMCGAWLRIFNFIFTLPVIEWPGMLHLSEEEDFGLGV